MLIDRMLFWALLPLVTPQAVRLRRSLSPFIPAQGPIAGSVGSGKPLRVLLLGDSIIASVGVDHTVDGLGMTIAEPLAAMTGRQVQWYAHGKIGARSKKVGGELLERVPHDSLDVIVVSVGVNDVTGLTLTKTWRRDLSALLDKLEQRFPHVLIVLAGIPPLHGFPLLPFPLNRTLGIRANIFNSITRQLVSMRSRVILLPLDFDPQPQMFSADGFHPSQHSYAHFGNLIAQAITARLHVV